MDLYEYEEAESVANSEESLIRLTSNSIVGNKSSVALCIRSGAHMF
ncbi:hypothetical protein WN943_017627 [Citrus x changshan-huyou]